MPTTSFIVALTNGALPLGACPASATIIGLLDPFTNGVLTARIAVTFFHACP